MYGDPQEERECQGCGCTVYGKKFCYDCKRDRDDELADIKYEQERDDRD